MKKFVINLLKYGSSAAIIAWLVWDAQNNSSFADLWRQPKNWGTLLVAWALCMAMVTTTIVRWYFLVRALDLPFRMQDAFRLGFLGYLLNFVSLGSVGGDLFKAVFIAREHRGRRAEAVATVVIDRIIGLYALFIVATIAIFWTGLLESPDRQVQIVCRATLVGMAVGTLSVFLVLTPGFTQGAFSRFLRNLPRTGPIFAKLLGAVRMYRQKVAVLFWTTLMSVGVHLLGALGIYMTARGLGGNHPSLGHHFVIVPLGMVVGVLPLPMSGLGAFEAVIEFFYLQMPAAAAMTKGQGLVVAFGYRIITVTIAIVGVFYYLASRREVADLLHSEEVDSNLGSSLEDAADLPRLSVGSEAPAAGG